MTIPFSVIAPPVTSLPGVMSKAGFQVPKNYSMPDYTDPASPMYCLHAAAVRGSYRLVEYNYVCTDVTMKLGFSGKLLAWRKPLLEETQKIMATLQFACV